MTLQAQTRTVIEQARDRYPRPRSAILPALWAVQHELGEITPEAMGEVAGILKVAPSEVEAVSTFYSMYFQHPHGRHEVIVSHAHCAVLRRSSVTSRPRSDARRERPRRTVSSRGRAPSSASAGAAARPPCSSIITFRRTSRPRGSTRSSTQSGRARRRAPRDHRWSRLLPPRVPLDGLRSLPRRLSRRRPRMQRRTRLCR
jgi:hypothetical protein